MSNKTAVIVATVTAVAIVTYIFTRSTDDETQNDKVNNDNENSKNDTTVNDFSKEKVEASSRDVPIFESQDELINSNSKKDNDNDTSTVTTDNNDNNNNDDNNQDTDPIEDLANDTPKEHVTTDNAKMMEKTEELTKSPIEICEKVDDESMVIEPSESLPTTNVDDENTKTENPIEIKEAETVAEAEAETSEGNQLDTSNTVVIPDLQEQKVEVEQSPLPSQSEDTNTSNETNIPISVSNDVDNKTEPVEVTEPAEETKSIPESKVEEEEENKVNTRSISIDHNETTSNEQPPSSVQPENPTVDDEVKTPAPIAEPQVEVSETKTVEKEQEMDPTTVSDVVVVENDDNGNDNISEIPSSKDSTAVPVADTTGEPVAPIDVVMDDTSSSPAAAAAADSCLNEQKSGSDDTDIAQKTESSKIVDDSNTDNQEETQASNHSEPTLESTSVVIPNALKSVDEQPHETDNCTSEKDDDPQVIHRDENDGTTINIPSSSGGKINENNPVSSGTPNKKKRNKKKNHNNHSNNNNTVLPPIVTNTQNSSSSNDNNNINTPKEGERQVDTPPVPTTPTPTTPNVAAILKAKSSAKKKSKPSPRNSAAALAVKELRSAPTSTSGKKKKKKNNRN